MELICDNQDANDCMIVAAYNALVLAGKEADYKKIELLCLSRGWYNPDTGFTSTYVDDLLSELGVGKEAPEGTTTADIRNNVKNGASYLILCKDIVFGGGHAVVAVKGKKGVKIINPNHDYCKGWRSLCKFIRIKMIEISAYEISL
jgi:hypothetical protein